MLRRLRETGPVGLVPLAWTFAIAAHNEVLGLQPVRIGHIVMSVLLLLFAILSWRDMTDGALLTWRRVIVVGFLITATGTAALFVEPPVEPVLAGVVCGWLVLPGLGLLDTGRRVAVYPRVYFAGGTLSLLGALVYAGGVVVGEPAVVTTGLGVGGMGQTAGIVAAAVGS